MPHPATLIATMFGVGYMKPAPGSWGSAAGLLILWPMLGHALGFLIPVTLAIGLAGWLAASIHSTLTGRHDAPEVVVDEVCGQLLTFWPLMVIPATLPHWLLLLLGFGLFRLFDILKPGPVGWLDRHVDGGLGVMLDDVAAGILAAACLSAMLLLLG